MAERDVLYPVQYARAFAALGVFYYHISATVVSTYPGVDVGVDFVGAAGVDLFFVISGFVMALVVARDADTGRGFDPRRFMMARIRRIAPLYWLVTLALFAAVTLGVLRLSIDADWARLVHSLLFLPYGMGTHTGPILLVGWTLNYELFFYALVALHAGWLGDRTLGLTAVTLTALAAIGMILAPANGYLAFYTDPILLEFALGIGCFHLWRATSGTMARPAWRMAWWALFLGGLALLSLQFERDAGGLRALYWGVPSFMVLLSGLHVVTLRSEFLLRLGDWSYALYLIHVFVVIATVRYAVPALAGTGVPWWAYYIAMTGVLVAASWATHELVERPLMAFARRFDPRRPSTWVLHPLLR